MAESSSAVKPPRFRFEDLPAELKLIIIKAALPEQRIFHVSSRWKDKYKPKETGADTYGFTFYYRHPPPALLSVCPAMRAAALQCGVFLDSLRGARGAFFVPAIDMLYLDERHAERLLQRWHGGSPDADAGRRPAIRHIGIECRNRHPDEWGWDLLEQSSLERRPSVLWAEMLATMCMRMPVLQSIARLHVRSAEVAGSGRVAEGLGAATHRAVKNARSAPQLVPLPEGMEVSCELLPDLVR
ncbi:hypothetical protein MY10362_007018 [Beauveria mimosiformis]